MLLEALHQDGGNTSLTFSIGSGKRGELSQVIGTPGPGSYNQPGKIGEGPKYGMRPKTAVNRKEDVPGPGQYNALIEVVKGGGPKPVMSKATRGDNFGEARRNPGPGAYMHPSALKGGPAFSFGRSAGIDHANDVPGPGAYRVPSKVVDLPDYAMPEKSKEFQFI
jgi:hypothetical protein